MFDSKEKLAEDIVGLLRTLRDLAGGDEACLLDRGGLLFETGDGGTRDLALFLNGRRGALFSIPESLEGDGPREDLFDTWEGGSVLLAFVNGRVVLALSCPDAEQAEERIEKPLQALVDRLLRYDAQYRLDREGRGLLAGRPRLDTVIVGRSQETRA